MKQHACPKGWSAKRGLRIDDFLIDGILGEGAFSWVYTGVIPGQNERKVFKVAKPREWVGVPNRKHAFTSKQFTPSGFPALAYCDWMSGVVGNFLPDTKELLVLQYEKLKSCAEDPALVKAEELCTENTFAYYRMEYIQGRSLRDVLRSSSVTNNRVPICIFLDLARVMDRLSNNPLFKYHGDLKPENIILTDSGIRLIDPGYVGPIKGGRLVTTLAYNPSVNEENDLLSVGIMLWEAALYHEHPLEPILEKRTFDGLNMPMGIGTIMDFWSSLPDYLPKLTFTRTMSGDVKKVLYKCFGCVIRSEGRRYRKEGDILEPDVVEWAKGVVEPPWAGGYRSFAELAEDLDKLQQMGIQYL